MTGLGRVGPLRPDLRPCPWPGCPRRVPPRYLLCPRHWCRLPEAIRQRINDTYRPGQTIATASPEYLEALKDALEFAREMAEGR